MPAKPRLISLHSNPVRKALSFPFKVRPKTYLHCFNLITKAMHDHLNMLTLQRYFKRRSKLLILPGRASPQMFLLFLSCQLPLVEIVPALMTVGWAQKGELSCLGHPAGEGRGWGEAWAPHQRGHQWLWPLCPRAGYAPPQDHGAPLVGLIGVRKGSVPGEPGSEADPFPQGPAQQSLPGSTPPLLG